MLTLEFVKQEIAELEKEDQEQRYIESAAESLAINVANMLHHQFNQLANVFGGAAHDLPRRRPVSTYDVISGDFKSAKQFGLAYRMFCHSVNKDGRDELRYFFDHRCGEKLTSSDDRLHILKVFMDLTRTEFLIYYRGFKSSESLEWKNNPRLDFTYNGHTLQFTLGNGLTVGIDFRESDYIDRVLLECEEIRRNVTSVINSKLKEYDIDYAAVIESQSLQRLLDSVAYAVNRLQNNRIRHKLTLVASDGTVVSYTTDCSGLLYLKVENPALTFSINATLFAGKLDLSVRGGKTPFVGYSIPYEIESNHGDPVRYRVGEINPQTFGYGKQFFLEYVLYLMNIPKNDFSVIEDAEL